MEFLNYHHLRYFWMVAQEGGLRRAAEKLRVSQPTISAQIATLEASLGEKLFRRGPRGLTLTETGQQAFRYARQIFGLGEEFLDIVKQAPSPRTLHVNLGVADSVPKLLCQELIKPIFSLAQPVLASCREGKTADLLAQLAVYRLDLVLADEPASTALGLRVFNQLLGECGVSFCAAPALAARLQRRFPRSLDQAPVLLPTASPLRRSLESWFLARRLRPRVVAEYDDAALMKVAALDGLGFFPLPSLAAPEAVHRYGFRILGEARECREQFFAISAERKITHPAVRAITSAARAHFFSGSGVRRRWDPTVVPRKPRGKAPGPDPETAGA